MGCTRLSGLPAGQIAIVPVTELRPVLVSSQEELGLRGTSVELAMTCPAHRLSFFGILAKFLCEEFGVAVWIRCWRWSGVSTRSPVLPHIYYDYRNKYINENIHIYIYIYVYIIIHIHIYLFIGSFIRLYVYINMCIYICIHIIFIILIIIIIYLFIYIRTYIHINI